jgi:hypothetical protein
MQASINYLKIHLSHAALARFLVQPIRSTKTFFVTIKIELEQKLEIHSQLNGGPFP